MIELTDPTSGPARGTIVVVDDDLDLAQQLQTVLHGQGYQVAIAGCGADCEPLLESLHPDLLLLDVLLPDVDGLVFLAQLRPRWQMPVILMSDGRRRTDRVLGLKLGADDFVPKPFDLLEVAARVEAVLRRVHGDPGRVAPPERTTTSETRTLGALTIHRGRRAATVGTHSLDLTPTEFQLLSMMASRPTEVFSREELVHTLWGPTAAGGTRKIDVHVRRLRQKLAAAPDAPTVSTVWGYGYKLDAE